MIRETRFRAFHRQSRQMCNVVELHCSNGVVENLLLACEGENSHYASVRDVDLCEYIGCEDKEGRAICECDVVKKGVDLLEEDSALGEVVWNPRKAGFGVKLILGCLNSFYGYGDRDEFEWWELEVVGNVFENPDLLKKVKK